MDCEEPSARPCGHEGLNLQLFMLAVVGWPPSISLLCTVWGLCRSLGLTTASPCPSCSRRSYLEWLPLFSHSQTWGMSIASLGDPHASQPMWWFNGWERDYSQGHPQACVPHHRETILALKSPLPLLVLPLIFVLVTCMQLFTSRILYTASSHLLIGAARRSSMKTWTLWSTPPSRRLLAEYQRMSPVTKVISGIANIGAFQRIPV